MNIPSNYIGEGKYLELWNRYIKIITHFVKKGDGSILLNRGEFDVCGDREKFSFSIRFENCRISKLTNSAVARDLKAVLEANEEFMTSATGKVVVISMTTNFELKVTAE